MTTDSSPATSQTSSQPASPASGAKAAPAASAAAATPPLGTAATVPASTDTPAAPAAAAPTPGATPAAATPAAPGTPADPAKAGEAAPAAVPVPGATPAAAAAPVIPESYVLPEIKDAKGVAVPLNPALLPVMGPAFKAAGLTQEAVNGLVKTFVEYQTSLPQQMLSRDLEVTMKDPALGGLNWGTTQGQVNEALAAFTTPEFRSKLERWGIANDLEFVRVFAQIGKAMRGDIAERGQPNAANELSQADRIYGRKKV